MCFPGMPSVFYGDELGVAGILEDEYRQPMPWGKRDTLSDFFQKIINLRHTELALTDGDYHTLIAEKNSKLYGFERIFERAHVQVLLNMGEMTSVDGFIKGQEILVCENMEDGKLMPYGFVITKSVDE